MRRLLRLTLLFLLTSFGCYTVFHLFASVVRPDLAVTAKPYPEDMIERVEREREVDLERAGNPVLWMDVDYGEGETAPWYPKGESPVVKELVKEGKLPPVAERVGPEPLVMRSVEGIGRYGGSIYQNALTTGQLSSWLGDISGGRLVRWSPNGYPIVPAVARAWETNEDKSIWRFYLRKGTRWSDGHPFTASDVLFWWEASTVRGDDVSLWWMNVLGRRGDVVRIDDQTVEFRFSSPYSNFLEQLSKKEHILPEHYLRQYHDILGDPEAWERGMRKFRVPTPRALYVQARDSMNPERPVLYGWTYQTYRTSSPYRFVRNPYFYAVDQEGNQLPYLDSIHIDVVTSDLLAINASTGRLSFQSQRVRFKDYTLLMENQDDFGYRVLHWYQGIRSMWSLFPNINRRPDENNPMEVFKAAVLKKRAFRQAMSLAINRKEIIDTMHARVGRPGQLAPGPGSAFHYPKLEQAYVDYDPERANDLLDDLGLTRRDMEGFRTTPDGEYVVFFVEYESVIGMGPAQFVVDDWAKVGIRAVYRERARSNYYNRKRALKHDFTVFSGESEFLPLVEPRTFVPTQLDAHFAQEYARWYMQGGMSEDPKAEMMGGLRPEEGSAVMRVFELYEEVIAAQTREEQIERFHRIFDINADEIWSISITPSAFQPVVVNRGLRNVPDLALFGFFSPSNAGSELFYWEDPVDPPGVREQLKQAMITVTGSPREGTARADSVDLFGGIVRFLVLGILVVGVTMVAVRHPAIGQRLLLMIPTLTVISIIVFTVIRLPPSDFVQTKILELQASGQSEVALQEMEELRILFHLDEPVLSQYLRWIGLHWFLTFDRSDRGLLQGDLGRSMEGAIRVNEMVGDRIILTLAISLGTVLFTWALAIPIGIYSAVRQYSVFDYVLTFGGFIGMCIPPFLLALILMYLSTEYLGIDTIGLFSPEYAAQPVWTWGKVVDLIKHLWVPVLVLGLGGTTGMIRVMRGNLLDEIRKPYVVTARAKGVRPMRLLLKYPVRLALNPFVSGIGALFPQLISGGAIVAVVLGIPTVGPLMLNALMAENTYLAGSLLMVLSLLGVFGMLVSDLLLMWLDPRIRFESGSK